MISSNETYYCNHIKRLSCHGIQLIQYVRINDGECMGLIYKCFPWCCSIDHNICIYYLMVPIIAFTKTGFS